MPLDIDHTRERLQQFDFTRLFIEELGWSNPASREAVTTKLTGKNSQASYTRKPIAQLSGVAVLEVTTPAGIPDAKARAAIAKDVAEHHVENLLIFLDAPRTQSLWYWVKREAGKAHPRDHLYVKGQPGDLFLGKLAAMVVDISELDAEGNIPITEVANRLKTALDVERITKKFYKEFDTQRLEFIEHIHGIEDDHQRRWYASVLMNRLMFIYFLQKKLFLDGGSDNYLEDKLAASRRRGPDKFYSVFLKALFFEGFARPEPARCAETRALLGKIRYLNGGLFLPHRVEINHGFPDRPRIKIPDVAFENVLALFRRYSWNLNDTPGGKDDEINPDVLGYIFEKYINQKEFGAYYTRPEMTGYLCERTIYKLVLDRINERTLALTPALSRGERGKRSAASRRSSASDSPGAECVSPSPPSEGGEGRGEVGAGHRQFQSISDLLLNLDATLCRSLLFDVLPSLRLLDPACGSAAFLVAAMKVLIAIYSAVIGKIQFLNDAELTKWHSETKTEHPSVLYFIKKRIITDNLFGVDIMEEATEIARLRLFLALVASAQTEDQLEPLPNIDFNILAGNSLIGLLHVDPAKFDAPAASPARGKRGNGQQRMTLQHTSDLGFAIDTKTAPTQQESVAAFVAQRNAEQLAAILDHKNKSIELYRKHAFEKHEHDAITQDVALMQLRSDIENVRREAYARLNQMLLDEFNALGIKFEQTTWDDRKNDTGRPDKRPLKLSDIEALQPFHWGYEFDKVMADGGFDGIITNPPWEVFKPNSKEFFEQFSELVSKKNMTIHDFEKAQVNLLKDAEILAAWLEYLGSFPHLSAYYRAAPQFTNQISIINGKKAGSDLNLYKLFVEQCFNLLRPSGRCGILTPAGIYTDLGAKQLRELLFGKANLNTLFGLSNERFLFEGVHHAQKFALVVFERGSTTEAFEAAFRINPREAISAEELDYFLHDAHEHVLIPTELVRRLSPDSLSVMEFKDGEDIKIAEKMLHFPMLGETKPGTWSFKLTAEFHMTNDSHLFRSTPGRSRLPLFEGKMLWQFDHQFSEPRFWVDEKEGRRAVLGRQPDNGQKLDYQAFRCGVRAVASNTNERTLICSVVPAKVFCGNSVLVSVGGTLGGREAVFVAAVLNSLVLDAFLRMKVSQNINMFYLYQLPVPRLTAGDAAFGPIVKRAAQLICTTPEFDALAKEAGLGSHKKGVTDAAARTQLRAELDGMIAHLYGLTEAEFAHILTTFPLVAQPVKDAALEAYRAVAN